MQPETLSWTTLEFHKKERHPDWHWTAGLVAVVVAVLAFFYHNLFFGIFALVAGGVVIFFSLREPRALSVVLGKDAVSIGNQTIPYPKIDSFSLDEEGETAKLSLVVKTGLVRVVVVPIVEHSKDEVRTFLLPHLSEKETPLSFSKKIFDRLGF